MMNLKYLLCTLLLIFCFFSVKAQKSADRLFAQGVSCMKTQTVVSQNKAISYFAKARVAYDSQSKKAACNKQIAICRSTIKRLSKANLPNNVKGKSRKSVKGTLKVDSIAEAMVEKPKTLPPTELSLSQSELTLEGKGGINVEVLVNCNYSGWKVTCAPDWLTYTEAHQLAKIVITAEANPERAERAGILQVRCRDKSVEILIKQEKGSFKLFRKKKK